MIECNGARIAHWEQGPAAAPTVILLHGYPDTHRVWDEVVPLLAERLHVVTFDLRGMGESVAPAERGAFRLSALARDLGAVADAVSPGRPVHAVGHDWGAFVVWEALAARTAAIASFTALAGPRVQAVPAWVARRLRSRRPADLAALAGQARRSWYLAAVQLPLVPELVIGRAAPGIDYPSPTLAHDATAGLALYRSNMRPRLRPSRRAAAAQAVRLAPVEAPVQLIVPTLDAFISPALYDDAETWATTLWRRDIRAGHWAQRSHPEPVARAIAELIHNVEGASQPPALRRARRSADRLPLQGRLAVVTGAGSGIGRATAWALGRQGVEVVCADIDPLAARDTASAARSLTSFRVDVADAAAMESFAAAVEAEHGVPDIVVNNAGIGIAGPFLETTSEEWERVVGVNLWGVIHGARLFAAMMVRAGVAGQIINVASAAAYAPSRSLPAYSTTKAGVLMLSACLRAELAGHRVGVTAVCPGFINTNIPRTTRFVGTDVLQQAKLRRRAAEAFERRAASPDLVAAAVLDAVRTNPALVPVTREAKVLLALSRIAPPALRGLARLPAG